MAISPIPTPITCPKCRQIYTAPVEQIFDVGQDPGVKARFLRGRFNQFVCPNCGFGTRVSSPILYHDPAKSLLLTYIPMEIGLKGADQERLLGRLVQSVIQALPAEQRKGYLFTPQPVLTLQGLVDRILDADGITAEVREAQRARAALLQQLMTADEAQLAELAKVNDSTLDYAFFEMLTASAEAAAAEGDQASAQRLFDLRTRLLELSSLGRQTRAQARLLEDTARELEALGDRLTHNKFVELVISADNEDRVAALIALARPLADYAFFQKLSDTMEAARGAERERLEKLRETVLRLTQEIDEAARTRAQQTSAILQQILNAPDPRPVIEQFLPMIDESFMAVLSANIEHATRNGRADVAQRLQQVADAILTTINEAAPPEIRLINDLLRAGSEEEAKGMVRDRAAEMTPDVLDTMKALGEDLKQGGQAAAADRLEKLRALAEREAALARWK